MSSDNFNKNEDKEVEVKLLQEKVVLVKKYAEDIENSLENKLRVQAEIIASLKENVENVENEKEDIKRDRDALKRKYVDLTSKLRDRVECPVCLEVPMSGPVYSCPYGHLVCKNCKRFNCPTCRCRGLSFKSLLAVTVIENIEYKCKNENCEEVLDRDAQAEHEKVCPHRLLFCPAPKAFCGKKVALSNLYSHLVTDCEGSLNHGFGEYVWINESFPVSRTLKDPLQIPLSSRSELGLALLCNDAKFYVNYEKAANNAVFSVTLLGEPSDCRKYETTIIIHKLGDDDTKENHVKLVMEPLPVEIGENERKNSGLMVSYRTLEKIAVKSEDLWCFVATVNFNKQ